jgi:mono/diheme cytochrome c family protein
MKAGRSSIVILLLACLPACRQEMARQPAYRPLRASAFFVDGRSARPLVAGTIARGSSISSGKRTVSTEDYSRLVGILGVLPESPLGAVSWTTDWSFYRQSFPAPVTLKTLERGQERFNIYCSVCHGRVGDGKGMIPQRGFTAPPSLHTDWSRGFKLGGIDLKVRDAPVGYYFEVVTNGFGAMPDYADQVEPHDRWAIIAYIRALQFSQRASLADVAIDNEKTRLLIAKERRHE